MGVLAGKSFPLIVMRVPVGPFGGETVIAGVAAAALAGLSTTMKQSRPQTTDRHAPRVQGLDGRIFEALMPRSKSPF